MVFNSETDKGTQLFLVQRGLDSITDGDRKELRPNTVRHHFCIELVLVVVFLLYFPQWDDL
jgi:hypothetical protein